MGSSPAERDDAVPMRRRLLSLPTLLSFGVAAGFTYFLATQFDLDWSRTWVNVRGINPWLYMLAFALYYVSFAFRGLRWRVLAYNAELQKTPGVELPSALRFSQLIVIGWFVNSIGWLRAGDAYRAYALSADSNGDFSSSLGTVLAERVADMITVLALILVGVAWFSANSDASGTWLIAAAAFVMAVGLATLMVLMRNYGARFARFLPDRFQGRYHRFHSSALDSLKRLPVIFVLGVAGWMLEVARLYFVVLALGLEISLPLVLVVALGHAILSTVPTPGGVGAVEPGVTGLLTLGLARGDAVSITLVDRTITYLSVIVIGGVVFLLWQASQSRRRRARSSRQAGLDSAGALRHEGAHRAGGGGRRNDIPSA